MGRLIVVVVVLVAIALVVHKFVLKGDEPAPADGKAPAAASSEPVTKEEGKKIDAESAAAGAVPSATVQTDIPPAAADSAVGAGAANVPGEELTDAMPSEEIDITDPSLTAGIPGEGALTKADLEKWLANAKNHVALKPKLPLGFAAGQDAIKGLDKNPLTRAKIELGRQLYFDQRLSVDASISCASCHVPEAGYAAHERFGIGVRKQQGGRNSPVAYNRVLSDLQFWDGRAESLEEQAKGAIENLREMSNTHRACVAALKKAPGYVLEFNQIFEDGLTIDNAARAIASFERVLVTGPSPWDVNKEFTDFKEANAADLEDINGLKKDKPERYAQYEALKKAAEASPISESAVRGGKLFFSDKAGCTACHVGVNYTDEQYHNLGVGMDADKPDLGRFEITKVEKDKGAFKTPTVRNVAMTGPYMHDGSQKTLEEVVEWYAKGGHANQWLDAKIKKLVLTDQDKKDLVAFMTEGLAGPLPKVQRTRLPADAVAAAENAAANAAAK